MIFQTFSNEGAKTHKYTKLVANVIKASNILAVDKAGPILSLWGRTIDVARTFLPNDSSDILATCFIPYRTESSKEAPLKLVICYQ